jgi:hypothetical protein
VRRLATKWLGRGVALGVAGYASYAASAWLRYGHARRPDPAERDALLDQFMPDYDVAERHQVRVCAPADITLCAAATTDLQDSLVARALFDTRGRLLGAKPHAASRPKGLLADVQSLGWRVLAEIPGREIVLGALTQPWKANVVFRCPAPEAFRQACPPNHVKIVWTLRVDPIGSAACLLRTETRVVATDATARRKFRWYWAAFSAGIILIRGVILRATRRSAERRAADFFRPAEKSSSLSISG